MGVYIKGMEMPTNCFLCPLSVLNGERLFCEVTKDEVLRAKKPSDCPIVLVPDHGRLIDADALKQKQQEDADLFKSAYTLEAKIRRDESLNAVANIVNAPTIIPADEEAQP